MIISGGVNIYPQETEDVLITHPDVADVAVFGVPNEEMGEEVKAVVQPHDMAKAGKELEAELIVFCRKHLSPIKCPKSIDFEAELPRTPDRQAGEAASARQVLAEGGGEGVVSCERAARAQRRSCGAGHTTQTLWLCNGFVMPGLVPGIHVFTVSLARRRGWPEQVRP